MAGLVVLNWPFLHVSRSTLSWKAVFIRCSSGSSASEEHKNFDTYFPLPHANGIFSVISTPFLFFNFILDCIFPEKTSKSIRSTPVKCPLPSWKKAAGSHLLLLAFIFLFNYLIFNSKVALILLAVMWACEGLWSYFPADLKSSAESHSPGHISSIFRTPDPFCKRDQALLVPTCSYLHLLALECMVLEKGFQKRSWLPYTACPH